MVAAAPTNIKFIELPEREGGALPVVFPLLSGMMASGSGARVRWARNRIVDRTTKQEDIK